MNYALCIRLNAILRRSRATKDTVTEIQIAPRLADTQAGPDGAAETDNSSRIMIDVRFESEMPVSIDKAPRHYDSIGWSATALSYGCGEINPPHYHLEGQLLFAIRGVMLVQTAEKRWVIPPKRALWIPPLMIHSYRILSLTHLRAVYVSPALISECSGFKRDNQVHAVNAAPLVKELIACLFTCENSKPVKRKMAVLLLEAACSV